MRKKKILSCILIFGILLCLLSACKSAEEEQSPESIPSSSPADDTPLEGTEGALKVAVFASKGYQSDGYRIWETIQGPSYFIGPYRMGAEFVYKSLIEDFSEQTGIPVEIEYCNYVTWIHSDADVLIIDTTRYTPTEMLSEEYCYDLTPFFEEYGIYSNGLYIEPVLRAGQVEGKQLIFPLTFNMSVLMGSEESLARSNLSIKEGMTYEELVDVFIGAWGSLPIVEDRTVPLMDQTDWTRSDASMGPYRFFANAGGLCYDEASPSEEKIMLDQLLKATEKFLYADLAVEESEIVKACKATFGLYTLFMEHSQSYRMSEIIYELSPEDWGSKVGCIASGAGANEYYPFATQALYYEHAYEEMEETFFCMGMPKYGTSDQYRASVVSYGIVPAKSKQPYNAYKLLQFLAEADRPVYYDMSVNRECIAEMFDQLTQRKIDIVVETTEDTTLKEVGPLSEESRDKLMGLIDHIEEAYFPDRRIDSRVYEILEKYFGGSLSSSSEVYDRIATYKASLMPKEKVEYN